MKLIIHGGFFSESHTNADVKLAKQEALKAIVTEGHHYLKTHTAVETVVYVVSLLENDPLFNAGIGSQIQSDGQIRMSASIMDGHSMKFSGVINIEKVQNPVFVAHKLMAYDDRVLGGSGANAFAQKNGFPYFDTEIPQRRAEYIAKLQGTGIGTVGCVALDANGHLAAATSTGGKGHEIPGRISDSATVAGNYADAYAGISCTGVGEDIVSAAISAKIATRVADGMSLQAATDKTFLEMKPYDGFAGAVCIDAQGNMYHTDSHPYMVWASYDADVQVFG